MKKKPLKITFFVLLAAFFLAFLLGMSNMPPGMSFSQAISTLSWETFLILGVLIIVNAILYVRAKE